MPYESWFHEIRTTKMNKQNGQVKIYKMVLLLCMLDRGLLDWFKPVTPNEIALKFYRYLTDNLLIRNISFGDKGKEKYLSFYDAKYISSLIKTKPMRYWGGNNEYSHAKYNEGLFWIDININPEHYKFVFSMTKQLCLERIKNETGITFDTRIDLHEEYEYLNKELENNHIAETEKESTIMSRIGQGKFRNRLFEKFNSCVLCGIQHRDLLIASHIKPWKSSNNVEKLDIENGFILCPNHDKLFDRGFLTFMSNGEVLTSRRIDVDLHRLNISSSILYELSSDNREYLEWHREEVFDRGLY